MLLLLLFYIISDAGNDTADDSAPFEDPDFNVCIILLPIFSKMIFISHFIRLLCPTDGL